LVNLLVQKGADINEKFEKKGVVPECVEWENVELLKLFIQLGCDVNQTAKKKNTPLHMAAKKNKAELVDVLLKAGANPKALNSRGKTP
jgi:ankyrin repeat protein